MKNIGRRLVLISFLLAIVSSIIIFIYLQSLNKPKEVVRKKKILVAVEKIKSRTMIDKKMIKEIEVTEDSIFNGYISKADDIVGRYAKDTILQNEGFRREKLIDSNGNDLGYKLEEKHRALSINATGEAGVAYLLQSEDYVDIIVYLAEKKDGQEVVRPDMAKMILQNVKVLAVDKRLTRDEGKEEEEEIPNTFLVTLSVPVEEVEKLVLAEDIGNLKLVLRPLRREDDKETKGSVWQELSVETPEAAGELPLNSGETPSSDNGGGISPQNDITYYTVKRGDTLRGISKAFYGDKDKYIVIKEFNDIGDGNIIVVGEIIGIPTLKK